jgi:hypothetical protein
MSAGFQKGKTDRKFRRFTFTCSKGWFCRNNILVFEILEISLLLGFGQM